MDPDRAAFVAAVRARPGDRLPRLVFADWLDDRGDPLGGYIRAECDAADAPAGGPEWRAALGRMADLAAGAAAPLGGWDEEPTVSRIADKVARLRLAEARRVMFGGRRDGRLGHAYQIGPPIPEPALIGFEIRHGVCLPGEYRAFLLRVGNGGMGPGHDGVRPLDPAADYGELRQTFPRTNREAAELSVAFRRAVQTRDYAGLPHQDLDDCETGTIFLSDLGCGAYSCLVVRGEQRGWLWAAGGLCFPKAGADGRPVGFFDWYEGWLDRQ